MYNIRIGDDSAYRYSDPRDFGYMRTLITRRQLKKVGIGVGRGNFFVKADVYWNPDQGFRIEYLPSSWGKFVLTVAFPVMVLGLGIFNIREHWRDYCRQMRPKKYGAFSSDDIALSSKFTPVLQSML